MNEKELSKRIEENKRLIIGGLIYFIWILLQAIFFLILKDGEQFLIFLLVLTLGVPGLIFMKQELSENKILIEELNKKEKKVK